MYGSVLIEVTSKESIRRDRFGFGMIIYGRVDVNITQNNVILFSNLLDKIAI